MKIRNYAFDTTTDSKEEIEKAERLRRIQEKRI